MRQHAQQDVKLKKQRVFTASELAEFEYCPLAWWHEQFEPHVQEEEEELFARMVELEHEHGQQASAMPEYRVIEQLLLRRGAFETGQEQHRAHAEEVEQVEEEYAREASAGWRTRTLVLAAVLILLLAAALIGAAIFLR